MKHLLAIVALFTALYTQAQSALDEISTEDIPRILSIIKEGTRENLPIILDEYTTLFEVVSIQNIIEYRNMINTSNESVKELLRHEGLSLEKTTFENNRHYLCEDEETRLLLQKGAIFVYIFYDFTHKELFRFNIQEQNCLNP